LITISITLITPSKTIFETQLAVAAPVTRTPRRGYSFCDVEWIAPSSRQQLLHRDCFARRGNAIGHDLKRAGTGLYPCWDVNHRGDNFTTGCNAHSAVIMGPGIENMVRGSIRDSHDGIVTRHSSIIAVVGANCESIELRAC